VKEIEKVEKLPMTEEVTQEKDGKRLHVRTQIEVSRTDARYPKAIAQLLEASKSHFACEIR
jgi:hypothetical protein